MSDSKIRNPTPCCQFCETLQGHREEPDLPRVARGKSPPPPQFQPYTLARKDYMRKFLFSELISRQITCQLQEYIFRELISWKLHITYPFVIQRITWKNNFGIIFLENLISVT